MRVLVVNDALPPGGGRDGDWEWVRAELIDGNLYSDRPIRAIDFDVFILDLNLPDLTHPGPRGVPLSNAIVARLQGGGCAICFAGNALHWLPRKFGPIPNEGKRIRMSRFPEFYSDRFSDLTDVAQVVPEALYRIIEKHAEELSFRFQFEKSAEWVPLAEALTGNPIAGYAWVNEGLLIMLPEFRDRSIVVAQILSDVVATALPSLADVKVIEAREPEPRWLEQFSVPGAEHMEHEIAALSDQIQGLRRQMSETVTQLYERQGFRGLLWLNGHALEIIVEKALNLLGVPVVSRPPVDLACPNFIGGDLLIEVEGSEGPIQIRKGRQLLGYLADSEDPSVQTGAIIGNPFRLLPPDERPPSGSQVGLFSEPLKRLAKKQSWPCLTTTQLFDWVTRHLEGDESVAKDARKSLGLIGLSEE